MYKNLKLICILMLLASQSSYSQLDELSMLGSISDRINESTGTVTSVEDPQPREIDNQVVRQDFRPNYKANSYGYTGGESFNSAPINKFPEKPLEYFGYEYFSDRKSNYLPQINVPIPPNYIIGPDDTIKIILFGNNNKINL